MDVEQTEIKLNIGDEEVKILLSPLKRKTAMKTAHTFIGLLQSAGGQITLVDFDDLEKISNVLFLHSFIVREDKSSEELKDPTDFFADKLDIWYEAIAEALRANCPDFFQRLVGKRK